MSDDPLKKVDARGRRKLLRGSVQGMLEALIRTDAQPTPEQQQELEQAGYTIRSIAGIVLSGTLDAAQVDAVARLPFVRKIELARPLYQEQPQHEVEERSEEAGPASAPCDPPTD